MKYAANLITAVRIFLVLLLPLFLERKGIFLTVYLISGLTDLLDGWVARRTKTQSIAGAKLDSVADILLFAVLFFALFQWYGTALKIFLPGLGAVLLLRLSHIAAAAVKFRTFAFLHTWGNKLTGLLIFLFPVAYLLTENVNWIWPPLIMGGLSAMEELCIHLTSDTLDLNRRGLFFKASANDKKE